MAEILRRNLSRYVNNKWMLERLCRCIGLISNGNINLINTKGMALLNLFPFIHKVLNLTGSGRPVWPI